MTRAASLALSAVLAGMLLGAGPVLAATAGPASGLRAQTTGTECPSEDPALPDRAPVLAHYYIWFNASSWNRAKTDFPAAGRYSSDQRRVMQRHVDQARAAGVEGFIVSWKSTDALDARLRTLRDIAADDDFGLAITYQAQDFHRDPLPVAQVRDDLEAFAADYAEDPVFHVLGSRPVVAISGTWHYSLDELRDITEPVGDRLTVLATEKDVEGYERVAPAVGGNLYYWSSGDPQRTGGYREKLLEMADRVRAHCGVWVAPVAPGYDARLLGGARVIDRRDGATLRSSWEAALTTVPHAIGVISWNEFSENTHVEPSTRYGARYLDVLSDLTGAPSIEAASFDSSDPQGAASPGQAVLVLSVGVAFVVGVGVLGFMRRRSDDPS